MKKIIFALFFLLIFFPFKNHLRSVFAQNEASYTMTVFPAIAPRAGFDFPSNYADETTETVTITFHNLTPGNPYQLCLRGDKNCHGGQIKKFGDNNLKIDPNGDLIVHVCGDGTDAAKIAKDNAEHCNDKKDYFWAQHIYRVTVIRDDDTDHQVSSAGFYVGHYYPKIDKNSIVASIGATTPKPGSTMTITLSGTRRISTNSERNDYKVEIASKDAEGTELAYGCGSDEDPKGKVAIVPETVLGQYSGTTGEKYQLDAGSYVIKINEQINEGSADHCEAGFTYYKIYFTVDPDGGTIDDPITDPAGRDIDGFLKVSGDVHVPPCGPNTFSDPAANKSIFTKNKGNCPQVSTAIGPIDTNPLGFIKSVMTLLLSLAGGVAVLLIITSGYQLMISQGNPEKIQQARERLTSAIVGLLFVIFSLVIMQIITKDILKIPGFS